MEDSKKDYKSIVSSEAFPGILLLGTTILALILANTELDRYYNYMLEKYPDRDLERTNPNRDHARKLTVKEYKEFKEIQREFKDRADELRDKIDKLKDLEKQVDDRDKDLVDYRDYLDEDENQDAYN